MHLRLEIDIPQTVKESIYYGTAELRKEYPSIQWINKDDYRLELFRFGSTYPREFLIQKIQDATFDSPAFSLYSHKLRVSIKDTITLYLSFYESKGLKDIVRSIKSHLSIHNNLIFYPDVVVARSRIPAKQQYLLLKKKCMNTIIETEFRITQLTLYNSVNENSLITYQTEATFPLAGESR